MVDMLVREAEVEALVAAVGAWDESLHPRGKDGKFIRKFGIVKFLNLMGGWDYGQVVGMNKGGGGKGDLKITVRPSDLKGTPTGKPDVDLPPSKLYSAPKAKATLTTDNMKKIGGQGGSNPGGLYQVKDTDTTPTVPGEGIGKQTEPWVNNGAESMDKKTGHQSKSTKNFKVGDIYMDNQGGGYVVTDVNQTSPSKYNLSITSLKDGKQYNRSALQNTQLPFRTQFDQYHLWNNVTKGPTATNQQENYEKAMADAGHPVTDPTTEVSPTGAQIPSTPEQYYVKKAKSAKHGNNEALANALYEEAGVYVPEVSYNGDTGEIFSKIEEGKADAGSQIQSQNAEWLTQIHEDFAVDAWLANWDVFGMSNDNIKTTPEGKPVRIDNGGALLFRAMGAPKGADFGSKVGELDSLKSKRPQVYKSMSKESEIEGAKRVLAISPERIEELVAEHHLPKSLADTLKARRQYIAEYYDLPLPETVQPPGSEYPTSAPLVDPVDDMYGGGMPREWSRETSNLFALSSVAEPGDQVRTAKGMTTLGILPVSGEEVDIYTHLAALQAEGGPFQLKKGVSGPRIPDGGVFSTSPHEAGQLADLDWHRGDRITVNGATLNVLGVNRGGKTMMVAPLQEEGATEAPTPFALNLLNLPGKEIETHRWNPEAPQVPEPPAKSTQAEAIETAIKEDLVVPLPNHGPPPPPAKAFAPAGEGIGTPDKKTGVKSMPLGDGTVAETGDKVVSKFGGEYTFVKPKGPYAVVTDETGKEYLKKASTLTQPDKAPDAAVLAGDNKPKTADGKVPELGMHVLAKDGKGGEVVMVSPDGKFVFFMFEGKKVRKSTGTLTVYWEPEATTATDAPGTPSQPQGFSDVNYGTFTYGPFSDWDQNTMGVMGHVTPESLTPNHIILVMHANGTQRWEPFVNQPPESLITDKGGYVAYLSLTGLTGSVAYPSTGNHLPPLAEGHTTYRAIVAGVPVHFRPEDVGPENVSAWGTDGVWYTFSKKEPIVLSGESGPYTAPDVVDAKVPLAGGFDHYSDEGFTLSTLHQQGMLKAGDKISTNGTDWLTVDSLATVNGKPYIYLYPDEDKEDGTFSLGYFPITQTSGTWFVKGGDAEDEWHGEEVPEPPAGTTPTPVQDLVIGQFVHLGEGEHGVVTSYGNGYLTAVNQDGSHEMFYFSQETPTYAFPYGEAHETTGNQIFAIIDESVGSTGGTLSMHGQTYTMEAITNSPDGDLTLILKGPSGLSHVTEEDLSFIDGLIYTADVPTTNLYDPSDPEVEVYQTAIKDGVDLAVANPPSYSEVVQTIPATQLDITPTDIYFEAATGTYWQKSFTGLPAKWNPESQNWAVSEADAPQLVNSNDTPIVQTAQKPPLVTLEPSNEWVWTTAGNQNQFEPPLGHGVYEAIIGSDLSQTKQLVIGTNINGPFKLVAGPAPHQWHDFPGTVVSASVIWDPWKGGYPQKSPAPEILDSPVVTFPSGAIYTPEPDEKVLLLTTSNGVKSMLVHKDGSDSYAYYGPNYVPGDQKLDVPKEGIDITLSKADYLGMHTTVTTLYIGPDYKGPEGEAVEAEAEVEPDHYLGSVKIPAGSSVFETQSDVPGVGKVHLVYNDNYPGTKWAYYETGLDNLAYNVDPGIWSAPKTLVVGPQVDIPETPAPVKFKNYVPKPGDKVVQNAAGKTWVQPAGEDGYKLVFPSGMLSSAIYLPGDFLNTPEDWPEYKQVWPAGEVAAPLPPAGQTKLSDYSFPETTTSVQFMDGTLLSEEFKAKLIEGTAVTSVPAGFQLWVQPDASPPKFYFVSPDTKKVSFISESMDWDEIMSGWTYDEVVNDLGGFKQISLGGTPVSQPIPKPNLAPPGYDAGNLSPLTTITDSKDTATTVYLEDTGSWAKVITYPHKAGEYTQGESIFIVESWDGTKWNSSGEWVYGPSGQVLTKADGAVPPPPTPAAQPQAAPLTPATAAWSGSLMKSGEVPKVGMAVTGKGPMSGTIYSISKDGTKATVLTSDGKKSSRLIEALSFNPYADPSTLGGVGAVDIPKTELVSKMTVKETLESVFNEEHATLHGIGNMHPGLVKGYTTVTNAIGPSGTKYARVIMTLTKEQRKKFAAYLASSAPGPETPPPMGDWVQGEVALSTITPGMNVSLRFSSTQSKWVPNKIASEKATHTIVSVGPWVDGKAAVSFADVNDPNNITTETFETNTTHGNPYKVHTYTWDPNKPAPPPPPPAGGDKITVGTAAKAAGWSKVSTSEHLFTGYNKTGDFKIHMKVEPGKAVSSKYDSFLPDGSPQASHNAVRAKLSDGTVIEVANLDTTHNSQYGGYSTDGMVVISIPEGGDPEAAYASALGALGLDYKPMTQQNVKQQALIMLLGLIKQDSKKIETLNGMSEAQVWAGVADAVGIPDVGWQDISVRMDEANGAPAFYWSQRVVDKITAGNNWDVVCRGGKSWDAEMIASVVQTGSPSSAIRHIAGLGGSGISSGQDVAFNTGAGSYMSGGKLTGYHNPSGKLFSTNKLAMGGGGMMVWHQPEAVLGRILPLQGVHGNHDNYGKGVSGDNYLKSTISGGAKEHSSDLYVGGGLGAEAISLITVKTATERDKAIKHLKSKGITQMNGKPIEDVIKTFSEASEYKKEDLPAYTPPADLIPILDLPDVLPTPAAPAA